MSKPPIEVPQGAIRFNTDSQKMEFFAQDQWWEMATDVPNLGGNGGPSGSPTGNSADQSLGARALIGGGYNGSAYSKNIDYFNISTAGTAINFGDMQAINGWIGALADRTRGIFVNDGGNGGGNSNTSYVTIASTGNSVTFGNSNVSKNYVGALASSTRGVRGGGYTPSPLAGITDIDYCTIQSTGTWKDFGDLIIAGAISTGKLTHGSGISSPTRGMWGGGSHYAPAGSAVVVDNIDYITIATTGDSQDFGNLSRARKAVAGCANSTRGIWSGGYTPTYVSRMDYVTLATLGTAAEFGDSTWTGAYKSGASSPTRGTWSGGRVPAGREKTIDYVSIASTGDAIDFGDLVTNHDGAGGCSNAHGGL